MALLRPTVVGPLSELSTTIRVKGQLVGATITVETGARTVAKGVATSSDQRFDLLSGVTLSHLEVLFAVQEISGERSAVPSGDVGMVVAAVPAILGPVNVVSHLYECGRFVCVDGACPGADVTILAGGKVLGTGKAHEGRARFKLTVGIPSGSTVVAHQSASKLPAGPDVSRAADPLPGAGPLPPPLITPVPRGCESAVYITGVFDGATVTVARPAGSESVGADRDQGYFLLSSPLHEGDQLTVRQDVDALCKRPSKKSAPVTVGPLEPLNPPVIISPLCAGATTVRVTGVRPGATVHLAANQDTFHGTAAADETTVECNPPPLTTDPVTATQELCGVTSAPAAAVTVDPHEAGVVPADVLEPLFSCAGSVCVIGAHPAAMVQVFSRTSAGDSAISGQVLALNTNVVVAVAPLLVDGAEVFVREWACSDHGVDGPHRPVKPHPWPGPVKVQGPIFNGDVAVGVRGANVAIPGSVMEVFAVRPTGTPEFLGSAGCDALHSITIVALHRALSLGEHIVARQRLCGQISAVGDATTVDRRRGFDRRPFYVVGHNTNTLADVLAALADGANALEPDVQIVDGRPDRLCISHGTGSASAPLLDAFLDDLHAVLTPEFALVVFDCKEEVTSPDHGFELLMAIRKRLTFDNNLSIIISIANRKRGAGGFFDRIVDIIGPREGLMIDEERRPDLVTNYFTDRGVTNQGYGDGITFANFLLGPLLRTTLETACGLRAQGGQPRFIYAWTVNAHDELREYLRIGVDGLITDDPSDLKAIVMGDPEFIPMVRMATRDDNPFEPANFAYRLLIRTRDVLWAGTNANVTFTLEGTVGSASKTFNTGLIMRMEQGQTNFVTIPSSDLGALQTITVRRDNQGDAPDWFLDSIDVRSARFGVSASAVFNQDITNTSPVTRSLI